MPVAPRNVNGVSYVTKINDAIHSAWQVTLVDGTCCSAHCN